MAEDEPNDSTHDVSKFNTEELLDRRVVLPKGFLTGEDFEVGHYFFMRYLGSSAE